jgi:hypothetical protein
MKVPSVLSDLLLSLAYSGLTHIASEVAAKISRRARDKANTS